MANSLSSDTKLPFWPALYTAFICVLFGSNAVAIKISLAGVGPFTAAAIRFSVAAVSLGIWAKLTGQRIALEKGQFIKIFGLSIIFAAQLSLFHLGISKTLASRGTLLVNFQPFFLLILAHFFIPGDKMTRQKCLGLCLGFLGVMTVFFDGTALSSGFAMGDLMVLLAAFLWALNGTYTKRIVSGFEPYQLAFYPMMLAAPFFLLEAWLWDPAPASHVNGAVIGALAYQSLVSASFGFVAWITLLKRFGAVALHSFLFIMPLAGVFLGGLILNEPITFNILLALALVIAGIFIVQLKMPVPIVHPGKSL